MALLASGKRVVWCWLERKNQRKGRKIFRCGCQSNRTSGGPKVPSYWPVLLVSPRVIVKSGGTGGLDWIQLSSSSPLPFLCESIQHQQRVTRSTSNKLKLKLKRKKEKKSRGSFFSFSFDFHFLLFGLATLSLYPQPLFLFCFVFILFSPARKIAGVCLGNNSICHDCFFL